VWEQFVFYNSRIVEKMKTIDFILDGKFHLHTPKKEGFRTKSKVALKKKGALFGHSSENAMREGCPGTMTGVSQYWFSGHFRQVFSTPMH
jgi:hypothetical protein